MATATGISAWSISPGRGDANFEGQTTASGALPGRTRNGPVRWFYHRLISNGPTGRDGSKPLEDFSPGTPRSLCGCDPSGVGTVLFDLPVVSLADSLNHRLVGFDPSGIANG